MVHVLSLVKAVSSAAAILSYACMGAAARAPPRQLRTEEEWTPMPVADNVNGNEWSIDLLSQEDLATLASQFPMPTTDDQEQEEHASGTPAPTISILEPESTPDSLSPSPLDLEFTLMPPETNVPSDHENPSFTWETLPPEPSSPSDPPQIEPVHEPTPAPELTAHETMPPLDVEFTLIPPATDLPGELVEPSFPWETSPPESGSPANAIEEQLIHEPPPVSETPPPLPKPGRGIGRSQRGRSPNAI